MAKVGDVSLWTNHVVALYGEAANHIFNWFAHRVQRPGDKINHALVLGGGPGVGKDTILAPLKEAVGPWNFTEVSPKMLLDSFNPWAQSVVTRISEAKDLGDMDRYDFYDATKIYMAAPPETLTINPKHIKPYAIPNVMGVVITTNYIDHGMYLPADDRRHYVCWTELERQAFSEVYWAELWGWYYKGGFEACMHWLGTRDLSRFNPKAPPKQTPAFWAIVGAHRQSTDLSDVIESMGTRRKDNTVELPLIVIHDDLITRARTLKITFAEELEDRKSRSKIPGWYKDAGYRLLRNPNDITQGRHMIGGKRATVYLRRDASDRDGFEAVKKLDKERSAKDKGVVDMYGKPVKPD
jgi:hypothetical protein